MHNGIVFEKDSLKLLLAFQKFSKMNIQNLKIIVFIFILVVLMFYHFYLNLYLTLQISEIEKMYPLYSDYEIDILKREKYKKDNFVSEVEAYIFFSYLTKIKKDKIFSK